MQRASLDDLAAFACVARLGNFTRAAAMLETSTSNLSHTIKRLETRLDARLLQRNSRSVSLTEAGAALLATLGPALSAIGEAVDTIGEGRDTVSGILRLTVTRQAYEAVIRPVLPDFTVRHPGAVVEISIDYGFRDIVAEGFDAGIRIGEKLEQDMIALKVGGDLRMAVVASPAYLARHGAPRHPKDLLEHRCINYRMVSAGAIYAWEFERGEERLNVRVPGPLVFNEPEPMLDCALAGLGVAYLASEDAAPHVEAGDLLHLLADWTPPFAGYHLYYSSRRQMRPVLSAFIEALRLSASRQP